MSKAASQRVYPALPDGLDTRLAAIELAAANHPDYFDAPDCPYPPRVRDMLRRLVVQDRPSLPEERSFDLKSDSDRFDLILNEVEATIEQMSLLETSLDGADTGDRIQFVKAKTSLLEKWVSIKERVLSMRELAEFQAIVVRFLEAEMSKDQRLSFIEALRGLRSAPELADLGGDNDGGDNL